MSYQEDDMLMLSGIQHYAFCPRQWALIHIEQQWNENVLTTEGKILHANVDNPFYRQKNRDRICLRSTNLASKSLGLYGKSDIIELHYSDNPNNAITHPQYPGYWTPYPIEYKHGKPKSDNTDIMQLVAQAMCIEEQYGITVKKGAFFYEQTRHRDEVIITEELRNEVRQLSIVMHETYKSGIIPKVQATPRCKSCSLADICMPGTSQNQTASEYLKLYLYEKNA